MQPPPPVGNPELGESNFPWVFLALPARLVSRRPQFLPCRFPPGGLKTNDREEKEKEN